MHAQRQVSHQPIVTFEKRTMNQLTHCFDRSCVLGEHY
jgi:hypothetical protein